jgi:hypothetical protein
MLVSQASICPVLINPLLIQMKRYTAVLHGGSLGLIYSKWMGLIGGECTYIWNENWEAGKSRPGSTTEPIFSVASSSDVRKLETLRKILMNSARMCCCY